MILYEGSISVFLEIGGGPLNVSLLILLFSYDMKKQRFILLRQSSFLKYQN